MWMPALLPWLLIITGFLGGCASGAPPTRMDAYLGAAAAESTGGMAAEPRVPAGGLEVGLLVLNDTTAPHSAPPISEKAIEVLTKWTRDQVQQGLPIKVTTILPAADITSSGGSPQIVRLAKAHAVDAVLLVVFSSRESDVPAQLAMGGPDATRVPGERVQNYALAEMALLDGKTGAVLARAEGRAWATLDRLDVPVRSNQYPVVRRALSASPIFPGEAEAPDTVRFVAGQDALEQAVRHLGEAWPFSSTKPAA